MDKYGEAFDIDLSLDSSVGQVSAGVHRFKCIKAVVEPNKAKDGHNLVLTLEVAGGKEKGRQVRTWISLKESARWKLTEVVQAFGGKTKETKDGVRVRLRPDMFVNRFVRANIVVEDYQGEDRASVDRILPDEAVSRPKPKAVDMMDDDDDTELEDLEDDLGDDEDEEEEPAPRRASAKSDKSGKKRKPEPEPEEDDEDEEDEDDIEDDLPF